MMKSLEDMKNTRTLFSFTDEAGNFVSWRMPDGLSASISAAVNAARKADLGERRPAQPRPSARSAFDICRTRDDCYAR
jgi:hypothetical protein